jgi:hypothetical protein
MSKKTARATIWYSEELEVDLMRMAAAEDRKLSDFIVHILSVYAYGQCRASTEKRNVANSRESSSI